MSAEQNQMTLDALVKQGLPLAYTRIFVNHAILDDETSKRVTLEMPKYRHLCAHFRGSGKPISKLEL